MAKLEHIDKIKNGFYDKRKIEKLKIRRPELFYNWNIITKENDEWILKHFLRKNRTHICPDTNKLELGSWTKNPKNANIVCYIKNRFPNLNSIEENLYWLYNNIEEKPKCPVCGGELKFLNFIGGYQRVCSRSCAALHPDTRQKLINTNIKRHGSKFYLGTDECIKKSKITIAKRNKENFYNHPKSNVTIYSSKGEKKLFEILHTLYPDVV